MNAWDHLPNAKHIDRILASVKAHPDLWIDAYNSIERTDRYWEAVDATWTLIDASLRGTTYYATDRSAARHAVYALLVHNDCAYMLDSDSGELAILAAFGDERAILLHAACIALNKGKK